MKRHLDSRFRKAVCIFLGIAVLTAAGLLTSARIHSTQAAASLSVTYVHGILRCTIPYHATEPGAGRLTIEVLDPEDNVLGRTEHQLGVSQGNSQWNETVKLDKPLALDELVWQRLRYRFEYDDRKAPIEATESISAVLRMPVVHILAQQSYLSGGEAAVRVIVTDSQNEVIQGPGAVRIELLAENVRPRLLFFGRLNRRGTTQAQFRFPTALVGKYQLKYSVDTEIGSTDFTQFVRLEDKAAILLTTEKPIYQPGQTIHVRALALDRANHQAVADKRLVFEVEDSRGNKVFKKITQTDKFGIASAEFSLAEEVNLGSYHLRALMGEGEQPANTAELALNVQKYVLPKFKVAVDFDKGKSRHGYRPGDHVTGTVHANYFFGKPVDEGAVTVKASGMDVAIFDAGSVAGKTNRDGEYHFDLRLANYFAGRPLSNGTARLLIEATVKDSAAHSETRGEAITVSESPLVITAVPEGGGVVPKLENQIFILSSYADGAPAKTDLSVSYLGKDQRVSTDDGGVGVIAIKAIAGDQEIAIRAQDQDGNTAAVSVPLQARTGADQILLRIEKAVYRTGDRIQLKVFSTKERGTAYVDVVKEGQTIFTRDLDIVRGQAELSFTAISDLSGVVDFNAYLFGNDAQPVGDHRLIFVEPADELKIEATSDATVYKPGDDAHVSFHVTNARGEGISAALGVQAVDEAVFALAEKQPGFAKVFFYLEQEVMKPRYEIHSLGMPDIVGSVDDSKLNQRDRAAKVLFAATELIGGNKFETEFGRAIPTAKYAEYAQRYQIAFIAQVERMAKRIANDVSRNGGRTSVNKAFAHLLASATLETRDAWGTGLRTSPRWRGDKGNFLVRSAGADRQFDTGDDMAALVQVQTASVVSPSQATDSIEAQVEHERGPFNGLGEITGTVIDVSGALVPGATVEVRVIGMATVRKTKTNPEGQFTMSGLPAGRYEVRVSSPGFRIAAISDLKIQPRDRAVLSAKLEVGAVTEMVEIRTGVAALTVGTGVGEGAFGRGREVEDMAMKGRPQLMLKAMEAPMAQAKPMTPVNSVTRAADEKDDAPSARVRSYFPEALYINPEIITDSDGRASISIPLADSITTWRMSMLASTTRGALGSATSSLKVFQDFFVDLDLPVTLTQGDRVAIPVAVYNYSGTRSDVSLKLTPQEWFNLVEDTPDKSISVDSARVGGSRFMIQAQKIGKFKLTLSAQTQGTSRRADIVVRDIEVIPNGREQSVAFNGQLEGSVEHEIQFPPDAIADASKIYVRLYPGPLSQIIEGMDKILQMPYGCFEQTSSSTYPNVLALDYMKRTKKLTPEVHAKAEGFIANGYQRLLTFEVPGGGFSWFGNAPANKILTAYGLMEFADMAKVHDLDPRLITRTQQWLASQQQADGSWRPDTRFINEGATNRFNRDVLRITAYLAWSLENTGYQGTAVERANEYIEKHMDGKADGYTLAVLANFAVDYSKNRDFTRRVMQNLLDAKLEKGDQAWWTSDETGVYSTGESASIETTGLAVQALLKWGEASGTARKALAYITAKKSAAGTWGTTQATIMALRALLLASEKSAADVHGTVEVLLNDKTVQTLTLNADNNDLLHQFVLKSVDANEPTTVKLRFQGKGGLAYQVAGSYFVPWDEKDVNEPLSINVVYDRTHLAQDDIATATATVKNNMSKTAQMVMVDLGVPPGFDLMSEDLQTYQEQSAAMKTGRLEKFTQTATQAILYFDSFAPGSTVTLKFRLRAKYPVRARTFKSRVYEYYDPAVSSTARPIQLEVRAR
jgi:A-macroglobulin TED domain/Alpha-2-macroglobulin family/Carboxypeptidase regulatory-like domain/MG2 domain/A-macroglobulin receptor binding domain/Alpha-2-macroglobulin bait region domain/Macroglobulin domain MG3